MPEEKSETEKGEVVEIPSSVPRIYWRHVIVSTPSDGSARIIFSDGHTVQLHIKEDGKIGTGQRLDPVAEIITDIAGLKKLEDAIHRRITEYEKQKGENKQ